MSPWIDRWLARLRAVFTKPTLDADFADELAHHLQLLTEERIKAGLTPEEASRQARIALGGVDQIRELHRETRGIPWLEQSLQDLRHAARMFRRERGFTMVALLILTVGIGLNTTVFSLVSTVLLRPLPFAQADRMVYIANGDPAHPSPDLSKIASRIDTWEGLLGKNHTLDRIEAYNPFSAGRTYRLTGSGEPETVVSVSVSPGLFDLLGMNPLIGRLFLPADGQRNAPDHVVLSHELWRRLFDADPRIVGRTLQINGAAAEVVGILPPADPFTSAFFPAARVDMYGVLRNDDERNSGNLVSLIGRMKPGVTLEAVVADLTRSVAQLKKQYPDRNSYFFANATPLHDWVSGGLKRPLLFLWIAAALVLALVSFNLGGLLLARGAARRKELALRSALGAGRMRLVRQLLTECFALVAAGSLLGGLLAWVFIRFLSHRSAVEIPLLQGLRLDSAALGFTVLLCLVTVVLCGTVPAWKLAQVEGKRNPLRKGVRGSSDGRDSALTRSTLVILEVALAYGLAISAGLFVRSFRNVLSVDLGFEPHGLIAVRIDPAIGGPHANYLARLLDRVRALPGVELAAITDCLPVERDRSWSLYPVSKDNPTVHRWTGAHVRIVSPGLFATMGTTLLAGRDFARADRASQPAVIIINQTLAKQCWPGEDPMGRQIMLNGQLPGTVIGVAADVRHDGPELPSGGEIYLPLDQWPGPPSWDLLVRTSLPIATLTADLHRAMHDFDAALPLTKVRAGEALVERTLSSRRLLVFLIGGFAAVALGLAALGLYGLISYLVSQQTKEIGIRMALGAGAKTVHRQIVGQTMKLALGGLLLGLAGTFAVGRLLQALLYEVSVTDVPTHCVMIVALLACAFFAGYLPARRASCIDPTIALRGE